MKTRDWITMTAMNIYDDRHEEAASICGVGHLFLDISCGKTGDFITKIKQTKLYVTTEPPIKDTGLTSKHLLVFLYPLREDSLSTKNKMSGPMVLIIWRN